MEKKVSAGGDFLRLFLWEMDGPVWISGLTRVWIAYIFGIAEIGGERGPWEIKDNKGR